MRVLLGIVVIYLLGLGIMFAEEGEAAPMNAPAAVPAVVTVTAETRLLSYREWKMAKMQNSAQKIQALRKRQNEVRATQPRSETLNEIQQELSQEQWNYEMARDLSTQDYLILYVKQQPGRDKLKTVASQMSQEEVTAFLEAYFNSLQKPTALPNYQRTRLGVQPQ